LMLETRVARRDLNLQWHNLLSVPVAYLILLSPALLRHGQLHLLLAALCLLFVALNCRFLGFVCREQGIVFTAQACAMSWLTYLYSGLGVVLGVGSYLRDRWRCTLRDSWKT
jgi:hypothetical protein